MEGVWILLAPRSHWEDFENHPDPTSHFWDIRLQQSPSESRSRETSVGLLTGPLESIF